MHSMLLVSNVTSSSKNIMYTYIYIYIFQRYVCARASRHTCLHINYIYIGMLKSRALRGLSVHGRYYGSKRMQLEHERYHGSAMNRMHSYHGRYHGSAMDALKIVCARTTDVIMVWPWMLWFDKARALKFSIPTYIYIYMYARPICYVMFIFRTCNCQTCTTCSRKGR